jgi:hypothetical protein
MSSGDTLSSVRQSRIGQQGRGGRSGRVPGVSTQAQLHEDALHAAVKAKLAAAREAAVRTAALAVMLTSTVAAAAAAPAGNHSQRRGAKRSADVAGTETQRDAAAQRDVQARAAAAQEETRGSGASIPGRFGLMKPARWDYMSKTAKNNWK